MRFILLAGFLLTGCVPTTFTKTVSVTKDANGNVIQRTESESVSKPIGSWPIKPEMMQKPEREKLNPPALPGSKWMGK